MTEYRPKKDLRKPTAVSVFCIVCAIAAVCLSSAGIGWRLGEQLAALIFIVVFIDILTRYFFTDYTYKLTEDEGKSELAVIKKGGNREMTVCNFELSSAISVQRRGKLREFEKENGRMDARYSYHVNMLTRDALWIYFTFNGKKILLTLEGDDAFFERLKQASRLGEDTASEKNDSAL